MPPLTGARLTPVTREEAAALAVGLLKLVEQHPWLGDEPLIRGYTRLLLAVPEPVPKPEPDKQEMLVEELDRALQEVGKLTGKMVSQRVEIDKLKQQLAEAQATPKRDDTEVQALQAAVQQAAKDMEQLRKETKDATALSQHWEEELDSQRNKIQQLTQVTTETRGSVRELSSLNGKLTTRNTLLEGFIGMLRNLEWSGTHPEYTYRGSNKKVACCPVCRGINPKEAPGHRDAGHNRGCFLVNVLKQAPPAP